MSGLPKNRRNILLTGVVSALRTLKDVNGSSMRDVLRCMKTDPLYKEEDVVKQANLQLFLKFAVSRGMLDHERGRYKLNLENLQNFHIPEDSSCPPPCPKKKRKRSCKPKKPTCCPKKKRKRSCKPKKPACCPKKKRKRSCKPKKPSCCPKKKRKRSCKPKKPTCCPKKKRKRSCKPKKPACCPKKKRKRSCKPKKPSCCPKKRKKSCTPKPDCCASEELGVDVEVQKPPSREKVEATS